MKKRILLFTAIAGLTYLTLSSEMEGPAKPAYQNNCTGAKNSGTTCGIPGCHGGGSGTSVTIELDSAGVAVNSYKAGMSYTVNIAATSTSNNLKFGFEYASVSGTGSTQVQAGTTSSYPANVGADALSGLEIVEHHAALNATAAGIYNMSFTWTAPATAGTGTVTMYCTLNAVNGDGTNGPQDISGNTQITLTEQVSHAAVNTIASDVNITAYPNPATNSLNIRMSNANIGTYTMNVFDISGKRIMSGDMEVNSATFTKTINTTNWVPGYYSIELINNGAVRMIPVVKQ